MEYPGSLEAKISQLPYVDALLGATQLAKSRKDDEPKTVAQKRYLSLAGGYGSGKTTSLARWHHSRALINRYGSTSWWVAPDYSIADDGLEIYRDHLENDCGLVEGRHFKIKRSPILQVEYLFIKHKVQFRTTNQKLQAKSASHLSVDEADECIENRLARAEARLRCPNARLIQSMWAGTPQGLLHFYKRAVLSDMVQRGRWGQFRENDRSLTLHYRSFWNHHVRKTGYFDTLWDMFGHDERFIKSFTLGIFTPFSGTQVYDYIPQREEEGGHITDCPYDPTNKTLITGWDFNLGNMAYVGYQIHNGTWIGKLECPPLTKNTEHACDQLINQVPLYVARETDLVVDGDANGWAGSKHGLDCEYDVIQNRLGTHFRRVIINTPNHNDAVAVRSMSTNRLFRQKRLLIDKTLRQTNESFSNTTWENNKIKKASGETVTHFSDAGSYPPSRAETIADYRIRGIG